MAGSMRLRAARKPGTEFAGSTARLLLLAFADVSLLLSILSRNARSIA
jgi:hypothetical protein